MYLKTLTPERQVSESGLRFLNPGFGRWCNQDPLENFGGQNEYAFAANEPIESHDPLGAAYIKASQSIKNVKNVLTLKVTCSSVSSAAVVGSVKVEIGLDAHAQKRHQPFLDIVQQFVGDTAFQGKWSQLLRKDYLGGFMRLTFTITDQGALDTCCECGPKREGAANGSSPAKAGWMQYRGTRNNLDQEVTDALPKGYPNPFYLRQARSVLVDFPGWSFREAKVAGVWGWKDRLWDELRCSNPRKGLDPHKPASYKHLLLDGKNEYEWAYRIWMAGTGKNPSASGALWYSDVPNPLPFKSAIGL